MIRYVGALIIGSAAVFAGVSVKAAMNRRLRILSDIIALLRLMRSEIELNHTPLRELLALAANAVPELSDFLNGVLVRWKRENSFSNAWREELLRTKSPLPLEPPERACLLELSGGLGRYDADNSCRSLEAARRRFEDYLAAADRKYEKQSGICLPVALCAGSILVLTVI